METNPANKPSRTRVSRGAVDQIVYYDPRIDMSPLSRIVLGDAVRLVVRIYRLPQVTPRWVLEVIDSEGGWTVWNPLFEIDRDALGELFETIEAEGIRTFLGPADTIH